MFTVYCFQELKINAEIGTRAINERKMSDSLLDILLESQGSDLSLKIKNDNNLRQICKQYLQDTVVSDRLLSVDTYTTTTTDEKNKDEEERQTTLMEEIAELEQQNRNINSELTAIANDKREIIIDINNDLYSLHDKFIPQFDSNILSIEKCLASLKFIGHGGTYEYSDALRVEISDHLKGQITMDSSVLSNIDSILDLLELPTLCRLCVLQGSYQEALDISAFVESLRIKFPKLFIFHVINNQLEKELKVLAKRLIALVSSNIKSNTLIRIFQTLGKLDFLNFESDSMNTQDLTEEEELRKEKFMKIIYLNGRFEFIQSEISNLTPLKKYNRLAYLKRFIEVYRELIFSTLSSYFSIFYTLSSFLDVREKNENDGILIGQFIEQLATQLVDEIYIHLQDYLNDHRIDDLEKRTQKDGLILQILYLCRSLTKYNVNFECIILSELIYRRHFFSEQEWMKNVEKVKKFKA